MQSLTRFWKAVIPKQGIYIASFLLLFAIGILGGKLIGTIAMDPLTQSQNLAISSRATPRNGQHNILLIGVDKLKPSESNLDSVWILITMPGSSKLTLIPIYPSGAKEADNGEINLPEVFGLTTDRTPNEVFLNQIRKQIWWDSYIMIDEMGFRKFAKRLDRVSDGNSELNVLPLDNSTLENLHSLNLNGPLNIRVNQMISICQQASNLSSALELFELLNSIDSHLISDFNLEDVTQFGPGDFQNDFGFECEFPTLTLSIP
jgi:hypothetical protein